MQCVAALRQPLEERQREARVAEAASGRRRRRGARGALLRALATVVFC
jgi:hypothetical protein